MVAVEDFLAGLHCLTTPERGGGPTYIKRRVGTASHTQDADQGTAGMQRSRHSIEKRAPRPQFGLALLTRALTFLSTMVSWRKNFTRAHFEPRRADKKACTTTF